jgi:hypothetical protein
MKIYNRRFIILVFSLLAFNVKGQISTNELPVSFSLEKSEKLFDKEDVKLLPSLDIETIKKEDNERETKGLPTRFGYPQKVNFNLGNSGVWTFLPNGDRLWQLKIVCADALSVNLLYEKFWIPEKAKFFIYSNDKKHSIGAFTALNNKGSKENPQEFSTGLIYSDSIVLEYLLPKEVKEQGVISISYVVHGYRYIYIPDIHNNTEVIESGSCQVNVNCTEGNNWQNEKNAVALILVNGSAYCTGSLINTTANDGRPLFLTANHCICEFGKDALGDSILNTYSFFWNYESPNCSPTTIPALKSTAGAVVVANNGSTDFALLRLTEDPKTQSNINTYYLGWDRTGNAGTGGVGIHHPNGDVKKISTYNITPQTSSCMNVTFCSIYAPNNNFWATSWTSTTNGHSVMEPGSSGSALINSSRRVIGQLLGPGNMGNCPPYQCDYPNGQVVSYGKFNVSWANNTNSRRRLSDWLDPNNTGVTTLDGSSGCPTVVNFTNQIVTSDTTVTSCGDINVQTVTVTNGAKLTLDAAGEVNIISDFEVELGSEFEIK